jgi:hypothetical protein
MNDVALRRIAALVIAALLSVAGASVTAAAAADEAYAMIGYDGNASEIYT